MSWRATEIGREKVPYSVKGGPLLDTPALRLTAEGTRLRATGTREWTLDTGARPTGAHLNGERLLVLTDSLGYHAWGHLGPALLLDAASGAEIARLTGERGIAHGDGFLLGLEGYDYFHTWHYGPDGGLLETWRSYGHYLPGGIVVECDRRVPTSAAVARLLPGGVVERGHRLGDGSVGEPVLLDDGTVVVADGGFLLAVDGGLRARELSRIRKAGGRVALTRAGDVVTAEWDHPRGGHVVRVRYRLHLAG